MLISNFTPSVAGKFTTQIRHRLMRAIWMSCFCMLERGSNTCLIWSGGLMLMVVRG